MSDPTNAMVEVILWKVMSADNDDDDGKRGTLSQTEKQTKAKFISTNVQVPKVQQRVVADLSFELVFASWGLSGTSDGCILTSSFCIFFTL